MPAASISRWACGPAQAPAEYPGWLNRLRTTAVQGLEIADLGGLS